MSALAITTFQELISLALRNSGVLGVGQTASPEDMNDAAKLLNAMLGQWQRRRYLVYHLVESVCQATSAVNYTVGPGGDFNISARPAVINSMFARQLINASPNQIDYPIEILPSRETYNLIQMKSLQSFPRWAYYDAAMPLGNLLLYPVVSPVFELHISYPDVLQSVSSLTDTVNLPPEYVDAMLYNLALELCAAYQLTPHPVVVGKAKATLETMRSVNAQIPRMKLQKFLTYPGSKYNILGDYMY